MDREIRLAHFPALSIAERAASHALVRLSQFIVKRLPQWFDAVSWVGRRSNPPADQLY